MDLIKYMEQNIGKVARIAARYYIKDTNGRRFMSDFALSLSKSAGIRRDYESKGLHVPAFLIASISASCNLHCQGCYARAGANLGDAALENEMSGEQWRDIFSQAAHLGVSFILLAGGEPMIRRDVLLIASEFKDIVFPVFTNGTLFDQEYFRFFDANRNLIPVLSMEGEGATTDARRGVGVYNSLIKAAERLHDRCVLYGASITVTTENMSLVTDDGFVSKLADIGCGLLFFIEYVPAQSETKYLVLGKDDIRHMEVLTANLKERFKDMIIVSFPGDEKIMGGCLAAGRGFFHINAAGGAEPCPFSPYSDMNLKDCSLIDAIGSPLFLRLRDEGILSREHTGGCVLFENREAVIEAAGK